MAKTTARRTVRRPVKKEAVKKEETALNDEVTDSVVQADTETSGLAPSNATGNYYQGNALALGLAALNATDAQQQNIVNTQASTPVGITTLYSINTATGTDGSSHIFDLAPKHKLKRRAKVKLKRRRF